MKKIILYNKHRNIIPIANENAKNYIFINFYNIWKLLYLIQIFFGLKHRKLWFLGFIKIIKPQFIFDVHWTSPVSQLCFFYDKKYGNKKTFVVIQHGVYTGGKIKISFEENHPWTYNFWVWSDYYKSEFERIFHNRNIEINIKVWGNPVYNQLNRDQFCYSKNEKIQKILIAPTELNQEFAQCFIQLIECLLNNKIEIVLKFHNFQNLDHFEKFKHLISFENSMELLKSQKFDLVICDVSTLLLDAIYYKCNVVFFQPILNAFYFEGNTIYDLYLDNLFYKLIVEKISSSELDKYLNWQKQEELYNHLIFNNSSNIILEKI